jgi:CD2 antigen cytoplasmic tail-binding protein 2
MSIGWFEPRSPQVASKRRNIVPKLCSRSRPPLMPPKSTIKRTGSSQNQVPSKRARFTEAEESNASNGDQGFDAQVFEDLEPASSRKGAVKVEGYDSDSTDDGEGVVFSRKSGANEAAVDEDDDMFAPSGASGKDAATKDRQVKKEEKFLKLGDIEGQEFGGSANGSEDEDEPEDEDEAERRRKKGMGFELTSFNMKAEMEEGKFAEDGTFVRSFDPHGVHDKWMDGLDEKEIKKARKSKKLMEEKEKERLQKEQDEQEWGKDDVAKELVGYLEKGETVLEALQRLGRTSKKPTAARKPRKGKEKETTDQSMEVDSSNRQQTPIERITSLASTLMSLGNNDAYQETYESLLRSVRRSGIVPPDWAPPNASQSHLPSQYEYRWTLAYSASMGQASTGQVFGPFGKNEMLAWRDADYFGPSGERVDMRKAGDSNWAGWDILS